VEVLYGTQGRRERRNEDRMMAHQQWHNIQDVRKCIKKWGVGDKRVRESNGRH
jgi:hypothetical protein